MKLRDKAIFRIKERFHSLFLNPIRKTLLGLQGARIGKTMLPEIQVNWPHQLSIGDGCIIEQGVTFKYDGIWSPGPRIKVENNVFIGSYVEFNIKKGIVVSDNCLISSGCRFIDHNHGFQDVTKPMKEQSGVEEDIFLDEDVWLGFGVQVLIGCTIGKGAIIGAGAVVTKSVPPHEIWTGIPARKMGERGEPTG